MQVENLMTGLTNFTNEMQAHKEDLSELDREIGDGDHGLNMARGTEALLQALNEKKPATLTDIFKLGAMTLLSKVGGAAGPLYGSAFMGMAKASMTSSEAAPIIAAGLADIQKRGKAEIGEKTMVDVWAPVSTALEANKLTEQVIDDAVEATKPLVATKGRASYLGERSVGHIDPGACSSGYFFKSLLKAGAFND